MGKEIKQLRTKAISSLVLCIDHFNRPWDLGRSEAVLILLDHAFEMLLKACIREKGGKIRKVRQKQTIGFDSCVRKALTDDTCRFLQEEQALTLQTINGLRDASQHYLVDVSEHQLYFYTQAGVTFFRDIHDDVFDEKLIVQLPERVLPVSTTAPKDLIALFEKEIKEIRELLAPGTRNRMDAIARARSLAVLESSIRGDYEQPSDYELRKICDRLATGEKWASVFPGVASINIVSEGEGHSVQLRLSKKEGVPVRLVKEGEGGGAVVAVKTVDKLSYYSMGFEQLRAKFPGMKRNHFLAIIWNLKIKEDTELYEEFTIGRMQFKRYSRKAIDRIREKLEMLDLANVYTEYLNRPK